MLKSASRCVVALAVVITSLGLPTRAEPVASPSSSSSSSSSTSTSSVSPSPASSPVVPVVPVVARRLDGASTLIVQTWKDGAAARLAHDHAIAATVFSGDIHYDAAAPEQTRIAVDVDARRLVVDDDRARVLVGLEPGVPAKDKDAVTASMTGPEQLDVSNHPRIRFVSTSVTPRADGTLLVEGRFTLRGQTRTVRLPVTVEQRADGSVRGRGTLAFKVSTFGIEPYTAFFGAVKVKDDVQLHLDLIAR